MALIFILLTQLINLTTFTIDFEVDRRRGLLPELRGGKNRFAKPSRVLRRLRQYDTGWKIRVLIDGDFTGIELDPEIILDYVRVVFRVERGVLCVDGVRENRGSDIVFRHRYFGCMRNLSWNYRPLESIDRSKLRFLSPQKESPKKKTLVEQDPRPPLKSPIGIKEKDIESKQPNGTSTSQQVEARDIPRPLITSPMEIKGNGIKSMQPNGTDHPLPLRSPVRTEDNNIKNVQPNGKSTSQQDSLRDDESFINVVDKDSFVHGFMIVFSLVFCIFLKFIF